MEQIPTVLIDRRNISEQMPILLEKMKSSTLVGFDTETQDVDFAHDGLKKFRGKDASPFDWRRMKITGFSLYFDEDTVAYYFNILHKDVENRIVWPEVRQLFELKPAGCTMVCHNAPFELTVMGNDPDINLPDVVCTMQMAVSAWGPDEYDHNDYINAQFGEIKNLFPDIEMAFRNHRSNDKDEEGRDKLSPLQAELISKILGKSSDATHSYAGFTKSLSFGYGLKGLVKKFFEYQMATFEETLAAGGATHMGELTGEQVADYGADDAYWTVKLFYRIYQYMKENCPETIPTFFSQENPMIYIFSDIRRQGLKVNPKGIADRTALERAEFAKVLREVKAAINALLPFKPELDEKLLKYEKWYQTKGQYYRQRLSNWAALPDSNDDKIQAAQVSSAVSNAWLGEKNTGDINLTHYFQSRLLMYDLTGLPPILYKGKVQSDAETRGEVKDKLQKMLKALEAEPEGTQPAQTNKAENLKLCITMVTKLGELASIEQRMKLYLTPYSLLTDPETGRMYPEVSSMLATRRMACSNPNGMQLAKRGESTYVRGFFLPDKDDHVLLSIDWSQIELVLIGEESGDPEFKKAFGQTPYKDLHIGAAADVLKVMIPEVTEEMLKNMNKMKPEDLPPQLLVKPNGEPLDPAKAKKFWRTEIGKGSNFNYWYSGALSTVGEKLGWTSEQMWKATEKYRERFAVAEAWRKKVIEDATWTGYTMLPDGHRRSRWEITYDWTNITHRMLEAYNAPGLKNFAPTLIKNLKSRAGNQLVNAKIQGSCATLAKRSSISINKEIKSAGYDALFKMPIHDELLFSVNRREVKDFLPMAKKIMCTHPEIVKDLVIDASASIGLTFEPFDPRKAPVGQIEIDEAPDMLGWKEGSKLNLTEIEQAMDYLFDKRKEIGI